MTRGLNRRQIGLTEAMVAAYGDTVWELSHNVQLRIGDPVRRLDWKEIDRQRPGTGMSDGQIAERIGLTRDQVTHIRLLLEHRRFRREHYHRLLGLGGGRRFRAERFEGPERRRPLSDAAMALRAALDFDPGDASRHLRAGWWGAATPASLLRAAAGESAFHAGLLDRAARRAARLVEAGAGPGEIVTVEAAGLAHLALALCAASLAGAALCPRAAGAPALPKALAPFAAFEEASAGWEDADPDVLARRPPVASDPLAILSVPGAAPRAVVHNAHTLLAGLDRAAAGLGLSAADRIAVHGPACGALGLVAVALALAAGAEVVDRPADAAVALRAGGDAEDGLRLHVLPETQLMFAGAADRLSPNPAMEARAVSESGAVLEPGAEGALEVRGANVVACHVGGAGGVDGVDGVERAEFTADRWLRTGLRCVVRPGGAVALLGG